MKRPIWFKAKTYGYGWYPATWQAWLIMAIWFAVVFLNFLRIGPTSLSETDNLIGFIVETIILSIILVAICYWTGEKPGWRWGKNDK